MLFRSELNILNSYTIESSFCGADFGEYANIHFNREMLEEIGHKFCETIYDFLNPDKSKIKQAMKELEIVTTGKISESEHKESNEDSDWESCNSDDENDPGREEKKKGSRKSKLKELPISTQEPGDDSLDSSIKKEMKPS